MTQAVTEYTHAKVFILDTNILLVDPNAIDKFEENYVVVSMTVLEELDGLKKRSNTEYEARQATNAILKLTTRKKPGEMIQLKNGGHFILDSNELKSGDIKGYELNLEKADNRIIAIANKYRADKNFPNRVVIVSNDATVRIKAHAMGIASEEFEAANYRSALDELYQSPLTVQLNAEQIAKWAKGAPIEIDQPAYNNQGIIIAHDENSYSTGIYRDGMLRPYGGLNSHLIDPLNAEQGLALQIALDPKNVVTALVGQAGTGKTILALSIAMQSKLLTDEPGKIYIFRPNDQVSEEMGFLPGNLDEKFNPHKRAIQDAYEVIYKRLSQDKKGKKLPSFEILTNDSGGGKMPILPINFIRGTTLHNSFVIIDEAQNFTPHQMKTLMTRVGQNSRVIITGDPDQIDNRFLSKRSCGLTHVIGNLRGNDIFSYVNLTQGTRSEVATVAAKLL